MKLDGIERRDGRLKRDLAWVLGCFLLAALSIVFVDVPLTHRLAEGGLNLPAVVGSILGGAKYYGQGFSALMVLAFMLSVAPERIEDAAFMVVALLATFVLVHFLKSATSRARPAVFLETGRMWWFFEGFFHSRYCSLPSAHTASAFAMSAALARPFRKAGWVLFLAAGLCGVSRIWDLQHYVSDVIVGAAVGAWIGYGVYRWRWSRWAAALLVKAARPRGHQGQAT